MSELNSVHLEITSFGADFFTKSFCNERYSIFVTSLIVNEYGNKKLLLQLKFLFQFSTIVSIDSEFLGQMGMGSSGYSRGLGRGDGSVGVMHKTSLNCCGEGISRKVMGIRICTIKKLGGCESAGNHGKQTDLKNE